MSAQVSVEMVCDRPHHMQQIMWLMKITCCARGRVVHRVVTKDGHGGHRGGVRRESAQRAV